MRMGITSLGLSTAGYLMLAKKVMSLADDSCDGRIVFVLEGYDPVIATGRRPHSGTARRSEARIQIRIKPDCTRASKSRKWHGFS
jgi:acetoin utilization deacetylase AcuC-like enzyme